MKKKDLNLEEILRPIPEDRLHELSREELLVLLKGEQKIRTFFQEKAKEQEELAKELKEEVIFIEGKYVRIKNKFFGKSSEKSPRTPPPEGEELPKDKKKRSNTTKLPSERYPNVPIIEKRMELTELPHCSCCGNQMEDSGMTEDSEYLTVIPKKYIIIRQMRHKYRCGSCHGDVQTTPNLPRIKPGSTYSDEMMIDVALSKYCDLIPIDRYVQMADRQGFSGLPPQSLIETTHYLSEFLSLVYDKIRLEIRSLKVLLADETPHRMLEGDEKSHWYLWGFSGEKSCYFECHDTRAGAVALEVIRDSKCEFLVSDVFSGYARAVREANLWRGEKGLTEIQNVYCNAHARRRFKEAEIIFTDAKYYVKQYEEVYKLEKDEIKSPVSVGRRERLKSYFEDMKNRAEKEIQNFSTKSAMGTALSYFLKNYEGLTLFLNHHDIPIDNNAQERSLRNPVVGRKTWYGTHSKRGAQTAAQLFSLVESCKINKLNPREYFIQLTKDIHRGEAPYTPKEYSEKLMPPTS